MKIVDCPWEIENIGRKTIEITVENEDVEPNAKGLMSLYDRYEYAVIKVPMRKIGFNRMLAELGFTCMEVQMNVSVSPQHFNYNVISNIANDILMIPESSKEGTEKVIAHMAPQMFSSDRITLDSEFGPNIGLKRYQNWLFSELSHGTSSLVHVVYKGTVVGFMLYRITDSVFQLLLNGLYLEWQGKHLGIITPSSPLLFLKQMGLEVERVKTSISSNNIPVVKLYNRLGFTLDSQTYVFTKHLHQI